MPTYLVTQASGQQSRWVIKHLLDGGDKVHAVARNPNKIPAILREPGVTLFIGETTDYEQIYKAAQGCEGVFLNTFPIPGVEVQQARTVVEACKKAGVRTLVSSSSFCAESRDKWDTEFAKECGVHGYYTSKSEVEAIVRGAGFDAYTIIRPGVILFDYWLPNVHHNFPELPTEGQLNHAFKDGARMPHTDGNDVGLIAAAALRDPQKFSGKEFPVASEYLAIEDIRDMLSRVSGKKINVHQNSAEEIANATASAFVQRLQAFVSGIDVDSEIAAAKRAQEEIGIRFTPIEKAFEREKDNILECLAELS